MVSAKSSSERLLALSRNVRRRVDNGLASLELSSVSNKGSSPK